MPIPSVKSTASAAAGTVNESEVIDFDDIFREHSAFVWRVLRGLGMPAEQVEDAVQDVFLVVHRRLAEFEARSSIKTWLFSIARNVAANAQRRRKRRPEEPLELEPVSGAADPVTNVEAARASLFMARFLDGLDEAKRTVFLLGVIRTCTKVSGVGFLVGAMALGGCSGGKVDIGDEGQGNTGSGSSKLAAFAGSWDGEVDLWEADSGSNRVRIELDADGQGTVRFGDRPIESAPDHPFPDDASLPDSDSPSSDPLESVLYPVREPMLDEGRLEFFVELGDILDDFCAMQAGIMPSCDLPQYGYRTESSDVCLLELSEPEGTLSEFEVPCSRGKFCYEWQACECSADACEAVDHHQIQFRMEREGGQMTGKVHFSNSVYQEIDFD